MRKGTVISAGLHATLITLVLVGDKLLPNTIPASQLAVTDVSLIRAADFDAALSQAPVVPDVPVGQARAPVAPTAPLPSIAAEPPAATVTTPAQRPASPEAPDETVRTSTESNTRPEPVDAPPQLVTPEPPTQSPQSAPQPVAAPPAPSRAPRGPAAPRQPTPQAVVDSSTPEPLPEPEPAPQNVPEPEPEPIQQAAVEPPPPPSPPAVAPAPAPVPEPTPAASAPRGVAPVARQARAPDPPPAAAAAEQTPAPQAPPARNPIDALVEQVQEPQTSPAVSGTADAPLTRAQRGALIAGIRRHFVPPDGIANAQSLSVTFLVEVGRDGRIMRRPDRVAPLGALDNAHAALERRALQALLRASQDNLFTTLPLESYDTWREMRITFTPEDLLL